LKIPSVDYVEMTAEHQPTNFPYTAVAFIIGASTSILAGYIGMRIAVYTNTRTTLMCCKGEMIDVYEDGK
jgi:Na+/H+-translocating membrane pyrophosphatase